MKLGNLETWLSFDGVDDYVQARDASVFDVTTGDFDMEVEYRSTKVLTSVNNRFLDKRGTGSSSGAASYQLSARWNNNSFDNTGVTATDGTTVGYAGSALSTVPYPTDGQWHKVRLTWENATGKLRLYVDGDLKQELTESGMIGKSITTSRIFTVGTSANLDGQFFEGDIRSFRFGTETFPMNEGTGTTVTGSEGTVLDIYGATWKSGPHLYITDIYLEFDGVDDYVEARSTSDLNFDLPIKIQINPNEASDFDLLSKWTNATESGQWIILERTTPNGFGIVNTKGVSTSVNAVSPLYSFTVGQTYNIEIIQDGTDCVMNINGVEHFRFPISDLPSVNPVRKLRVGMREPGGGGTTTPEPYSGKIYSFQIGTETFPMNEGTGTTITGSQGTVLDIYGAIWRTEKRKVKKVYLGDKKVYETFQ